MISHNELGRENGPSKGMVIASYTATNDGDAKKMRRGGGSYANEAPILE